MKTLRIIECLAKDSGCYKAAHKITPSGVASGNQVHSSGTGNPKLSRWINPSKNDPNYQALINIIGKAGSNHWNKASNTSKMAHAWIGKLADGTIGTVQCLPWNYRCWLSGRGNNGNANNLGYLGFEMAEDSAKNTAYLEALLEEAIKLSAYWVSKFKIPLDKVLDHRQLSSMGLASGHADIRHLKRNGWVWTNDNRDIMTIYKEKLSQLLQEGFKVEYFNGISVFRTEYINAEPGAVTPEEPNPIYPTQPEDDTIKKEYFVINNSTGLNQRERPSLESKVLGQWGKGQMLLISETTKDGVWGKVRDYHHWVMLQYTSPYVPKEEKPIVREFTVITSKSAGLNKRQKPNANSPSYGQYKRNSIVNINEVSPDGLWGKVKETGYWIMLSFTELYTKEESPTPKPEEDIIKREYFVNVKTQTLGQYSEPSLDSKLLGQWKRPQMLLISETTKDGIWGKVRDYHHWVMLQYTTK